MTMKTMSPPHQEWRLSVGEMAMLINANDYDYDYTDDDNDDE